MIFPRPIVRVGNCIAIIGDRNFGKTRTGEPIVHNRPLVVYKGNSWNAARLSYHLNLKRIRRLPKNKDGTWGKLILHNCNNKWCINSKHIYAGTHLDNIKDWYCTPESIKARRRISEKLKGRVFSKSHRNGISEYNKIRTFSIETRKRMSVSAKKRIAKLSKKQMRAWVVVVHKSCKNKSRKNK